MFGGSEKRICRLTFEFQSPRTLFLKSAVRVLLLINLIASRVWRLLPSSERAVIKSLCTGSDNETVLGGNRKLEGPDEHLIEGASGKRICRSTFEVRILLKSAVIKCGPRPLQSTLPTALCAAVSNVI